MPRNESRAFWSVDAAFALVLSVAAFAMFSAMLYAAGAEALQGAAEASGALLSARFSSFALGLLERGEAPDLDAVLRATGREYASLSVAGTEGEASFASAGEKAGEVYCTRRLMYRGGGIVRVEACIG